MTKSVTLRALFTSKRCQRRMHLCTDTIRLIRGDVRQVFQHLGGPKLSHVVADLPRYILTAGHATRDLIRHPDQVLLMIVHHRFTLTRVQRPA
jgi:hypothetical protein